MNKQILTFLSKEQTMEQDNFILRRLLSPAKLLNDDEVQQPWRILHRWSPNWKNKDMQWGYYRHFTKTRTQKNEEYILLS